MGAHTAVPETGGLSAFISIFKFAQPLGMMVLDPMTPAFKRVVGHPAQHAHPAFKRAFDDPAHTNWQSMKVGVGERVIAFPIFLEGTELLVQSLRDKPPVDVPMASGEINNLGILMLDSINRYQTAFSAQMKKGAIHADDCDLMLFTDTG